MDEYNQQMEKVFDIFCTNDEARQKLEIQKDIKMGPDKWSFLEDMRTARKMYCENFVDNVWQAQMETRLVKEQRLQRLEEAKKAAEERTKKVSWRDVVLLSVINLHTAQHVKQMRETWEAIMHSVLVR